MSDHNPLLLTLTLKLGAGERGWRLSPGWLQHDQVTSHLLHSIQAYWDVNTYSAGPPVVWESFKVVTRGEFISAIKTARMEHNGEIKAILEVERVGAGDFPAANRKESLFAQGIKMESSWL